MSNVIVRRAFEFPGCGLSRWTTVDYKKPLVLVAASRATAMIYAHDPASLTAGHIDVFPGGRIELQYRPAADTFIAGLSSTGAAAENAAREIYAAYQDAYEKLEALLMSTARVRHLTPMQPISYGAFFDGRSPIFNLHHHAPVEWKVDDGEFAPFRLAIRDRRKRRPVYRAQELVTPSKWLRMQRAANDGSIPVAEYLELLRIRTKAAHGELKIATIEASIVSEALLRTFGVRLLEQRGLSRNKIKDLRNDLTFNHLLNVVLPISLGTTELRRIGAAIQAVNTLRVARNDLVHGNKKEKEIAPAVVEEGIDGALKLAKLLASKLV